MGHRLLVINPGSTSTKIGIYEDEKQVLEETIRHSLEEIGQYNNIYDQFEFRKKVILDILKEKNIKIDTLDSVVGRGGLLRPLEGGTYAVNEKMIEDLKIGIQGQHASNLGGILAREIAKPLNIPAFIVDPVVVDEMIEIAKITGLPEIKRRSIFHALNQKAVAKRYAEENNKKYEDVNLIVTHMGGGVSVGAHKNGRVIDVNNALDGEGPFSPERSGEVPIGDLIRACYSGKYTIEEVKKKISGGGGIVAYLGTNDFKSVEAMIEEGSTKAKLIFDAFIYQVSKEIGKLAAVLSGRVDSIILTGGIAYSKNVVKSIAERVAFIAPLTIYPGEDELLALANGALNVLKGKENIKEY